MCRSPAIQPVISSLNSDGGDGATPFYVSDSSQRAPAGRRRRTLGSQTNRSGPYAEGVAQRHHDLHCSRQETRAERERVARPQRIGYAL
jgi:hypothetical protein